MTERDQVASWLRAVAADHVSAEIRLRKSARAYVLRASKYPEGSTWSDARTAIAVIDARLALAHSRAADDLRRVADDIEAGRPLTPKKRSRKVAKV